MKTNQEYKNAALAALKGRWAPALVSAVVFFLIIYVPLGLIFTGESLKTQILDIKKMLLATRLLTLGYYLFMLFVVVPLSIGIANSFRLLYEKGDDKLTSNMFNISFEDYLHKVWTVLLMDIKIFLWSLLFVIPGIIKAMEYSMTSYIMVEHPELTAREAIKASSRMMKGHRYDLFWLYLSFFGWYLLATLTLGIGMFWLVPYFCTTDVAFYESIKDEGQPDIATDCI